MKEVAVRLRALQLFAHNCHNLAKGPNFFSDHEYLGSLYEEYEAQYDDVVERLVGESDLSDLSGITSLAFRALQDTPSTNNEMFSELLEDEEILRETIDAALEGASEGTKNLLQDLADKSLARAYKIKRRLM